MVSSVKNISKRILYINSRDLTAKILKPGNSNGPLRIRCEDYINIARMVYSGFIAEKYRFWHCCTDGAEKNFAKKWCNIWSRNPNNAIELLCRLVVMIIIIIIIIMNVKYVFILYIVYINIFFLLNNIYIM